MYSSCITENILITKSPFVTQKESVTKVWRNRKLKRKVIPLQSISIIPTGLNHELFGRMIKGQSKRNTYT